MLVRWRSGWIEYTTTELHTSGQISVVSSPVTRPLSFLRLAVSSTPASYSNPAPSSSQTLSPGKSRALDQYSRTFVVTCCHLQVVLWYCRQRSPHPAPPPASPAPPHLPHPSPLPPPLDLDPKEPSLRVGFHRKRN